MQKQNIPINIDEESEVIEEDVDKSKTQGTLNTKLEYDQEIKGTEKRLEIEVIDFDWVFEGDNAKNLIHLLGENAKSKLLIQKSFRVFIEYMWNIYQPEIMYKVFVPFVIFMVLTVFVTALATEDFIVDIEEAEREDKLAWLEHNTGF